MGRNDKKESQISLTNKYRRQLKLHKVLYITVYLHSFKQNIMYSLLTKNNSTKVACRSNAKVNLHNLIYMYKNKLSTRNVPLNCKCLLYFIHI